ncbi:MAG: hypothetical protein ACK5O2_10790 [Microthrixaceae bacterium]
MSFEQERPGALPPPSRGSDPGMVPVPRAGELGQQVAAYLRGATDRADRRPMPRFGVLAAVAGAVLAVIGPLSGAAVDGIPDALGIVLYLCLLGGGYALVWLYRDGPLAAAGVTASALSLPMLLAATLASDADASLTPVVLLSSMGWLAAYLVGPARGHVAYLGFASTLAAVAITLAGEGAVDSPTFGMLWKAILVGLVCLAVAHVLDRAELPAVATAFVGPGDLVLAFACMGVLSLGGVAVLGDLSQGSTSLSSGLGSFGSGISLADLIVPGIALAAVGVLVLRYAVASPRRATAWTGAACLTMGLLAFWLGLVGENGIALLFTTTAVGAGIVYGAWFLSTRIDEPGELAENPSFEGTGLIQAVRGVLPVRNSAPVGGGAPVGDDRPAGSGQSAPEVPTTPPPVPGSGRPLPPPSGSAPVPPTSSATPPPPDRRPIDDLPPAPGWWKASDGHWYPPSAC